MTLTAPARPVSSAARRVGHLAAASVNAVLLYLVNGWPGWAAAPFLTDDTTAVLDWVNASLVVGVAVNLLCAAHPSAWLRGLGELVTATVGLVVLSRMLRVFPFDFGDPESGWVFVTRIVLVVGIVGTAVAMVVHAARLLRLIGRACAREPTG